MDKQHQKIKWYNFNEANAVVSSFEGTQPEAAEAARKWNQRHKKPEQEKWRIDLVGNYPKPAECTRIFVVA